MSPHILTRADDGTWQCLCGNEYVLFSSVMNHIRKNGGRVLPVKRAVA